VGFERGAQRDAQGRVVSLPVLQVPTAGGRVVHVSGKIDRMDEAEGGREALVIDYKSAAGKSMDLFRLAEGIALQLPVYALVVRELAKREPLGALYVALGLWPERVAHEGGAADAGTEGFYQKLTPRGLVDAEGAALLDASLGDADVGASDWYKLRFNKDGSVPKRGDLLGHGDFQTMLDFARWKIGALGEELAGGKIAPEPYRCGKETPCGYCDYASLCPFDQARGTFRLIKRRSAGEALEGMRRQMGAAAAARA
jgi:ATP-dependent helicase/nuclease subunit B